jgi:hypothetical protein
VQRPDYGVQFCPPRNSDRNPRRRGGVIAPIAWPPIAGPARPRRGTRRYPR